MGEPGEVGPTFKCFVSREIHEIANFENGFTNTLKLLAKFRHVLRSDRETQVGQLRCGGPFLRPYKSNTQRLTLRSFRILR